MDHFGSHQPSDQDQEAQYNPLAPKPPPPNTGQWANLVIALVVIAVIAGAVYWGWQWTQRLSETIAATSPEVVEATLTVSTANDGMVSDSAAGFPVEELAARPGDFEGKWVFTDATISWLMDQETGDEIDLAQAKEQGKCIYWLDGPIVVMDHREASPARGPGEMIRPWGKVVDVPADKLGLSEAGMAKLQAMHGYNGKTVTMIIARFVEWP